MIGIFTLLAFLGLALILTRIATVALRITGLSHDVARFQARSALSGVGFTTAESEDIVNHPGRRNIVLMMMGLSGAGVVTTLASLLASFVGASGGQTVVRLVVLVIGLFALWGISENAHFERWLSRIIERILRRWADLDTRDYVSLLHINADYSIAEIGVDEGDWLLGGRIGDLAEEGIVVLGVRHAHGDYTGAPPPRERLEDGDIVVLYGRTRALQELERRRAGQAGDLEHDAATAEHRRVVESLRARPRRARTRAGATTTAREAAHRATAGGIE